MQSITTYAHASSACNQCMRMVLLMDDMCAASCESSEESTRMSFTDVLAMVRVWEHLICIVSMQGQKALGFHHKYLNFV